MSGHPHGSQAVAAFGATPEEARVAVVLIHGRGATAASILELARHLAAGSERLAEVAWLAPQAAGNTWYPQSFLAPLAANQPYLDSALRRVAEVTAGVAERGVPAERTVLAGFSQGACLAAEAAVRGVARGARRLGGVAAFTGGLIGPPGTARDYAGSLAGTPAILAAGDPDPHVPWRRMEETAEVYRALGAEVDLRRYPGMGHTVNDEELDWLRHRLLDLLDEPVDGD